MNDYPYLVIKFVEELEKEKFTGGEPFLKQSIPYKTLFKKYVDFAIRNGLGTSRASFERGLYSVIDSYQVFYKNGLTCTFSETNFKEFKTKFGGAKK